MHAFPPMMEGSWVIRSRYSICKEFITAVKWLKFFGGRAMPQWRQLSEKTAINPGRIAIGSRGRTLVQRRMASWLSFSEQLPSLRHQCGQGRFWFNWKHVLIMKIAFVKSPFPHIPLSTEVYRSLFCENKAKQTELPPKLRRARGSDKESTATCQNHQKTTINNSKKMQSVCC